MLHDVDLSQRRKEEIMEEDADDIKKYIHYPFDYNGNKLATMLRNGDKHLVL